MANTLDPGGMEGGYERNRLEFVGLIERVEASAKPDIELLRRMLDFVEAYPPDSALNAPVPEKFRMGGRAMIGLERVAKAWMQHGSMPELRDRAVACAMRLKADEWPNLPGA